MAHHGASNMTDTPSSLEDKARMVLQVYRHFGLRPGEHLRENNFVGFAERKGWRREDWLEGLEHGLSLAGSRAAPTSRPGSPPRASRRSERRLGHGGPSRPLDAGAGGD
jgi:hypothetical protein